MGGHGASGEAEKRGRVGEEEHIPSQPKMPGKLEGVALTLAREKGRLRDVGREGRERAGREGQK